MRVLHFSGVAPTVLRKNATATNALPGATRSNTRDKRPCDQYCLALPGTYVAVPLANAQHNSGSRKWVVQQRTTFQTIINARANCTAIRAEGETAKVQNTPDTLNPAIPHTHNEPVHSA